MSYQDQRTLQQVKLKVAISERGPHPDTGGDLGQGRPTGPPARRRLCGPRVAFRPRGAEAAGECARVDALLPAAHSSTGYVHRAAGPTLTRGYRQVRNGGQVLSRR